MDKPPLPPWCWKGNKSISSHKPQRCVDETALQGHSKDYKYNFTLWLQVNKHCSGRSPAAPQSTTQPAACRLLQPTAVLSAQIITKDGSPSKQAFQSEPLTSCVSQKNRSNSEISKPYQRHLQDRGSFRNPATKRELRVILLCPVQNKNHQR